MMLRKLIFILCTLSVSSLNAANISVSFPSFNGNYIYPNGVVSETFDLGMQFSSIQNAELILEASGTAGLLQTCTDTFCTTESYGQDLIWGFTFESGHNLVFGTQDLTNTVTSYTNNITLKSSFLLDGAGEVYIQPNFISSVAIPGVIVTILQPSTYQINNVVLNIEGTVVPVPPAIVLFLSGLVGLVGINSKFCERKQAIKEQ